MESKVYGLLVSRRDLEFWSVLQVPTRLYWCGGWATLFLSAWVDAKVIFRTLANCCGMDSFAAKVAGTVVIVFGWLAFFVLYLAFFTSGFTFWQNLAVFIASGAIMIAVVAVLWIRWVFK